MTYFKINNVDFSRYVSGLKVGTEHIFQSQTNANGMLMARYKNTTKVVEVAIIPLDDASTASLLTEVNKAAVTISYLDPETKQLETISCIVQNHVMDYYTIRAGNVKLKAFTLSFKQAQIAG